MIVFAGNEDRWKYVLGELLEEDRKMESPGDGKACRAVVENAAADITPCDSDGLRLICLHRDPLTRLRTGRVAMTGLV